MERIPKNSVGLAGEFATLSQLALHGYDASMTLGNTKNIDILVFNPKTNKTRQVEVKTNLEKRKGPTDSELFGIFVTSWQMHEKHERIKQPDLFYCFVHINTNPTDPLKKKSVRYFIVPSAVVAKYVREEHRAWLEADPSHKTSDRRTFRIGVTEHRKVKVRAPRKTNVRVPSAPPAQNYEDKWELLA